MAGPWDFSFRPQAMPSESLLRGAVLGGGLVDAFGQGQKMGREAITFQQEQDDRAMKLQLEQAQRQKLAAEAAQFKADQERLAANPYDIELRAELATRYPKVYGSPDFKAAFDGLDKANQTQLIDEFSQVHSAIRQGRADVARDLLSESQVAFENAGRMGEAKSRARLAEMIDQDPELAFNWVTEKLASVTADKPEVLTNLNKIDAREFEAQKAQADADKATAAAEKERAEADQWFEKVFADIGLTNEQIRDLREKRKIDWARLDLDRRRLKFDIDKDTAAAKGLSEPERKAVAEAAFDSRVNEQQAEKLSALAAGLGGLGKKGEVAGLVQDFAEANTGIVGYVTEEQRLRTQYRDTFGALAIARLEGTKGATSDKDMALATAGFPPANSAASELSNFVGKEAQRAARAAQDDRFVSQYRATNGGSDNARKDIVIDGVLIPAGTSMVNAAPLYKSKRAKERGLELRRAGKTPEQVEAQMKMEGY